MAAHRRFQLEQSDKTRVLETKEKLSTRRRPGDGFAPPTVLEVKPAAAARTALMASLWYRRLDGAHALDNALPHCRDLGRNFPYTVPELMIRSRESQFGA
jgi:hypothetical protein